MISQWDYFFQIDKEFDSLIGYNKNYSNLTLNNKSVNHKYFLFFFRQMLYQKNLKVPTSKEEQLESAKNISEAPLKQQICCRDSIRSSPTKKQSLPNKLKNKIHKNKFNQTIQGEIMFDKNNYLIQIDKINIPERGKQILQQLHWILERCVQTDEQIQKEQQNNASNKKTLLDLNKLLEQKEFFIRLAAEDHPEKILKTNLGKNCEDYEKVFYQWARIKAENLQRQTYLWYSQFQSQRNHFDRLSQGNFGKYQDKMQPISSFLHCLSSLFLQDISVNYYLPSLLTIKFIGIDSIDELNQKAFISLKLELKVKVPKNAKYKSIVDRSLSKLKIKVKSNLNSNEVAATFLQEGQDWDQQRFSGFAILNEEDKPFSIWTKFQNYFERRGRKKRARKDKNSIKKLQNFEGVIYRADLKNVQVQIKSYLTLSPCEMLDITGYIEIPEIINNLSLIQEASYENPIDAYHYIILKEIGSKAMTLTLEPNLLNVKNQQKFGSMIEVSPLISIGDYDLAEKLIQVDISKSREDKREMKLGIRGWHWGDEALKQLQSCDSYEGQSICHFHFPIYRLPSKGLGIIYVPTIVLGIINLLIFFQDSSRDGLGDRIANNATLLISFVGMIAVLQQTFKKPSFTITSLIIYLVVLTPMLCMIETMILYSKEQQNNPFESALFWISTAIVAMSIFYPLLLVIFHFGFWQYIYNQDEGITASEEIILPGDHELSQLKPKKSFNLRSIQIHKQNKTETTIHEWQKQATLFWMSLKKEIYDSSWFRQSFLVQVKKIMLQFDEKVMNNKKIKDVLISKKFRKQKQELASEKESFDENKKEESEQEQDSIQEEREEAELITNKNQKKSKNKIAQ